MVIPTFTRLHGTKDLSKHNVASKALTVVVCEAQCSSGSMSQTPTLL